MISGRFCWGSRGSCPVFYTGPGRKPCHCGARDKESGPPPCGRRDEVAKSERRAPEMSMSRHVQLWLGTLSSRLRGRDPHSLTPTTLPASEGVICYAFRFVGQ